MAETVFLDSSFFKGLIDPKDDFYQLAGKIWLKLREKSKNLVTSNFIVDESLTLIRAKCNLETVLKFRDLLAENSQIIKIMRVTVADEGNAWQWFIKDWSRLSFTDCVSFALMKRLGITHAAAFDEHFKRAGFKVNYNYLNKYNKASVRLDKKRIIIEPIPDIMELAGSLSAYAIKNKPIEEIMRIEEEAIAKAIVKNYRKR